MVIFKEEYHGSFASSRTVCFCKYYVQVRHFFLSGAFVVRRWYIVAFYQVGWHRQHKYHIHSRDLDIGTLQAAAIGATNSFPIHLFAKKFLFK
ncbi:hypothetical protein QR685DRAFT_43114 [Neurospora intermedia]|uniref:Uncharacterized protein n=1 Tax=Neurospora intermedia TaxID=5142 RepID=A0ABR3DRL0_NEUIN